MKPTFKIKSNSQKGAYSFRDILTADVLQDVCIKLTGKNDYNVIYDDTGYNIGRLAILEYENKKHYISFSEHDVIAGRNSFFQSLTTALVTYYREDSKESDINFYFLKANGNKETKYHWFMYRLMATAGVNFINGKRELSSEVKPFISIDDLALQRDNNSKSNCSNNSTYVTKNDKSITEIYAKTYGANKKEAVLITIAASKLTNRIKLYEIIEQNLKALPKPDKEAILNLGNVEIITTDITMEKEEYEKYNSLRSPRFIYNLLERLGPKKCVLCNCEIPEIIQGAHILPVANIKKIDEIPFDVKLKYATAGENGLWLCENHHKLFDEGIIAFDENGQLYVKKDLKQVDYEYIYRSTPLRNIYHLLNSELTISYMNKRNKENKFLESEYKICK